MKATGFTIAGFVLAALAAAGARAGSTTRDVTYLPADKVVAAFAKGMPLVEVENYKVHASRREAPGQVEVHTISSDGSAALLDADGVTASTRGNPTDAALSHDGQHLYVRVAALAEIAIFRIASDGSLEALPSLTGTRAGWPGWPHIGRSRTRGARSPDAVSCRRASGGFRPGHRPGRVTQPVPV